MVNTVPLDWAEEVNARNWELNGKSCAHWRGPAQTIAVNQMQAYYYVTSSWFLVMRICSPRTC